MKNLPFLIAALALVFSAIALLRVPPAVDAFESAKVTNARAGVYGFCDAANGNAQIISKFNNRNDKPIFISIVGDPEAQRWCEISFPFKITNRVMLATYGDNSAGFVSTTDNISGSPHPYDVFVTIYDSSGNETAGNFYLVVY